MPPPSSHGPADDIENPTQPDTKKSFLIAKITKFKDWVTVALLTMLVKAADSRSWWERAVAVLCVIVLTLLLFAIVFPAFIVSIVWTGKADWIYGHEEHQRRTNEQQQPGSTTQLESSSSSNKAARRKSLILVGLVTGARVGILVLVWLPINLCVRALREDAKLLGTLLWKWSVLAAVILLLTPAILVFAYILTTYLRYDLQDTRIIYWIQGVEDNVRRVLYFAAILLVWGVYFAAEYDEINKAYRPVHKYIILTMVALLIGAILGVPKDIVVLWWKKKSIYIHRNRARIMVSAYQLCFLLRTDESEMFWILSKPFESRVLKVKPDDFMKNLRDAVLSPGTLSVQDKLDVSCVWSLQDIDVVANWLEKWIDMLEDEIPESADHHSYVIHRIKDKYSARQDKTRDLLTKLMSNCPEMPPFLREMLRPDGMDASNENPCAEFENQMIEWYKSSFVFINKLYEHFKLTHILFVILTVVQVVATIIIWIFITGLATAKLVVTLGSLFLGLTFVFGDTCKTFFQGCVFSFVTHPLHVGDLVSIDSIEPNSTKLEVKRINVMTTIFFQPSNKDNIIIYPNSELATKKILKFKGPQESGDLKARQYQSKSRNRD